MSNNPYSTPIEPEPDRHNWRDLAQCAGTPTDYFYPGQRDLEGMRQAKTECSGCPVTISCLEEAIRNNERGVWGGASEFERRKHYKTPAIRRDTCGTYAGYCIHIRRAESQCEECAEAGRRYRADQKRLWRSRLMGA